LIVELATMSAQSNGGGENQPDVVQDRVVRGISRRTALAAMAGLGIGGLVFQRAIAALAIESAEITPDLVKQAEWIAGIELTDDERNAVAGSVRREAQRLAAQRGVALTNSEPPALSFFAAPPQERIALPAESLSREVGLLDRAVPERPARDEDLAFLPVTKLAALVRSAKVTSTELTQLYLARLKKQGESLHAVVTLTEDLALAQAAQADREIAAGRYRGPLHGIPWGAKDLISVPGYRTTWGAAHFAEQTLPGEATVARRLREVGAVLVAKLSLGALALGDEWYGGTTRNPWNPEEGSSGSSAGSAAAVAAGLVGFAIGSETLGSIVSPCRRCSITGLRPTFGRISRSGCMTLAWSMDKLGPICRSVEDCALVLAATHGFDGLDDAAVDRPFVWPPRRELSALRVGYFSQVEESGDPRPDGPEIDLLRELGVTLVPIKLPDHYPTGSLTTILNAETAAAFDDVTLAGVREGLGKWATPFRAGRFISAVDYLRANRIRRLLMRAMEETMREVDLYVGGDDLVLTNLTGHPTVVIPFGDRQGGKNGQPGTLNLTGRLFGESELLRVAHAIEQYSADYLRRPPLAE
jgi:Asp-tRNA(Asn)/Glu-tRNA(Gln) amidotransferase A subunit family amidase